MHWYVVPIFQKNKESGGVEYVPGVGDPATEFVTGIGYTIHAANPKGAPTTALLGTTSELPDTPDAWAAKTLAQARAHFEAVTGREPTASEVL